MTFIKIKNNLCDHFQFGQYFCHYRKGHTKHENSHVISWQVKQNMKIVMSAPGRSNKT